MDKTTVETVMKAIKILKVNDFSVFLGRTSHGDLAYKIPKEGDEPHFTLDAVPVSKEVGEELGKLFEM